MTYYIIGYAIWWLISRTIGAYVGLKQDPEIFTKSASAGEARAILLPFVGEFIAAMIMLAGLLVVAGISFYVAGNTVVTIITALPIYIAQHFSKKEEA